MGEGGDLALELLDACIVTAPLFVFMTGAHRRREAVPGKRVAEACVGQIRDRVEDLALGAPRGLMVADSLMDRLILPPQTYFLA